MKGFSPKKKDIFRTGLLKTYNLTLEEFEKLYTYAGGDYNEHINYFSMFRIGKNIPTPVKKTACVCETNIKNNAYMWSEERKHLMILGRCCILRFGGDGKTGRTCGFCNAPHKNRSNNLCNDCRGKVCPKCCKVKLKMSHHTQCYKCYKDEIGKEGSKCINCGIATNGYIRCYDCHLNR